MVDLILDPAPGGPTTDGTTIFTDMYNEIANRLGLVRPTADRVIVSSATGLYIASTITTTKLGFLTDVTSNLQAQIDGKAATVHTHVRADITNLFPIVTADIGNDQVTYAKIQNVSVTDRLLGRDTAAAGDIEEISLDATLEFTGALAIRRAALTGDVTAPAGSNTTTIAVDAVTDTKLRNSVAVSVIGRAANSVGDPADIAAAANDQLLRRVTDALSFGQLTVGMFPDDVVTYAKIQNVSATSRFLGRITAAAGDIEELTGTQATTLLDVFTSALKGLAPASGGGTTNFLRADGTWAAPAGGGSHAFLSATHTDTVASTPVRGGVVRANATPAWEQLAKGADATVFQSDSLDALWRTSLKLAQITAPATPATNQLETYAFEMGTPQLRTKDEYGLVDVGQRRNAFAFQKEFFIGLGTDTGAGAADLIHWGVVMATVLGTLANVAGDADGQRKNFLTSATINTDSGLDGNYTQTSLEKDPDVTIKFKFISTTLRRGWVGWTEANHMASDSTAATHKFALRLSTAPAVTGFTIVHSDGTTEVVEAQIQASDALIHTIRLVGDNANSRWGYSFDGAAIVWITTNIPTAAQMMGLHATIRTLEAVAKNMDFWYASGVMNE